MFSPSYSFVPPKPRKRSHQTVKKAVEPPSFTCPDTEAEAACKSYEELRRARDEGIPANGYVCFRQKEDEFFVLSIREPYFPKRWDPDSNQMMPDQQYKATGFGYAHTFKNGVEDSTTMPTFIFTGKWSALFDAVTFKAEMINHAMDENDSDVGVSIDEIQINIGYKYKNTSDKTILYNLTIQRSTGRFVEKFKEETEKFPLLQQIGHCIHP